MCNWSLSVCLHRSWLMLVGVHAGSYFLKFLRILGFLCGKIASAFAEEGKLNIVF